MSQHENMLSEATNGAKSHKRRRNKSTAARRHFTLDALEPRLLLSATPGTLATAVAVQAALQPDTSITTVNWIGGATGDWNTQSNWSGDAVPNSNNNVTIPNGVTVTISSGSQSINSLSCSGGLVINGGGLTLATASTIGGSLELDYTTITTNGVLTVNGTTLSNGGAISGTGSFVNGGTVTVSNGLTANTNFTNNGAFDWQGGSLTIGSGATFTNSSGATASLTTNGTMTGSGVFANAGTFTYTNSTGNEGYFDSTFNNTGTLHVTQGVLLMNNAGTSSAIFNVDSGATLQFVNATYDITGAGAAWNGSGLYQITGFGTVSLDATASLSVQNAELDSYSALTGAGTFTTPDGGAFNWAGGSMQGTGNTTFDSGATVSLTVNSNMDTRTVDNYSVLNFSAGVTLNFQNDGVLNNETGATINLLDHSQLGQTGIVNNYGLVTSSDNTGNGNIIAVTFNNYGTVHATLGGLGLYGGGSGTAAWNADAGTTIGFYNGYGLNAGTTLGGAGLYEVSTNYGSAPIIVASGLNLTVENFEFSGLGILEMNGTLTIPSGGTFDLDGSGDNILSGTGSITITDNAGMDVGATQLDSMTVSGLTIDNYGTADMLAQTMAMEYGAVINNYGTFSIETGSGITYGYDVLGGAGGTFNNSGAFSMDDSGVVLDFQSQLNNDGSFTVTNGSVTFQNEGNSAGTSDGSFSIESGGTMEFDIDQILNPGASFEGAGLYKILGTLTLNDPSLNLVPANMLLESTITGSGSITVTPASNFNWEYGTISCTGGITIQHGATVPIDYVTLSGTTLTNDGVITCAPSALQGQGEIVLQNDAVFNNESDGAVNLDFGSVAATSGFTDDGTGTLNNAGSITITGNPALSYSASIEIDKLSNTGTLEIDGGTLSVYIYSTLTQLTSNGSTLSGGTWIARDGATLDLENANNLTTNAATIIVDGTGSNISALQNLNDNSGSLSLLNGAKLSVSDNFTNSGTLELGDGSTLTVPGEFTQTSGGTLTIHIGGTSASALFGSVAITGAANLAGTLDVVLDSFTPSIGDVYTLLTYASMSGAFGTLQNVSPTFSSNAGATSFTLTGLNTEVPDLSCGNVGAPSTQVSGANMTVTYTVTNMGQADASGSWTDSIYLSPGTVFDATTAVLLGQVTHTGGLAVGDNYNGSITAAAPALQPGTYYVIVITDSKGQISDSNRSNNVAASASTVSFTAPILTLGTPVNGTIANGDGQLYELDLTGNSQVEISLSTALAAGAVIYASYDTVPTPADFDQTAFNVSGTTATLTLSGNQPGPYYILVYGRESSGSGAAYTLTAQQTTFGITGLTPSSGAGTTTITIQGSQFAAGDTVTLIPDAGGTPLTPTNFYFTDNTTIAATFNLAGIAAGTVYDVQVANGTQTSTAAGAFTVGQSSSTVTNQVLITITAPEYVRTGVNYTIQVNYQNVSDQDAEAPLITLTASNALLKLAESNVFASGLIAFLGINTGGGPAGILPPGYQGSITVQVEQTVVQNHTNFDYTYAVADPSLPMNYSALEPFLESTNYSATEWAAIWANIEQRLGTTQAGYLAALSQDASLLPASMGYADNPIDVMQIEVLKSAAIVSTSISGQVNTTSPGLQLGGLMLTAFNTDTDDTFAVPLLNNGTFALAGLTAGDYTFTLDGAILGAASVVPVANNQQVTGIALTATAGATLIGATTDALNGSVLTGASITAVGSDGTLYQAISDANGNYSIAGLPADTYSIIATADGFAQLLEENVTIGLNGLVLPLSLGPASVINGTVSPATGTGGDVPLISAQPPGNTDPNLIFNVTGRQRRHLQPG